MIEKSSIFSLFYLLSLFIFILNILVANANITIVYIQNTTTFFIVIISILLFKIPFVIVNAESNGKNSQTFAYVSPNISFGKYIPLVKHTSWIIMLEIPEAALSETRLPISIPIPINSTAIIIDTKTVQIIFILNCNPKNKAVINNNTFCNKINGINETI